MHHLKRLGTTIIFALSLVACAAISASADVKVKTRQTSGGQTYESTTYIKGKRQRVEQNLGDNTIINLTECDLKRSVQIMPQSQTFLVNLWNQPGSATTATTGGGANDARIGGVVTTTYTIKDTGERKQMFGYTARHLIITVETESSPDACNQQQARMQIDGWYIDATFALDCQTEQFQNYSNPNKPGCQDRYEMKQNGTARRGYPVSEKMTIFDSNGKELSSTLNEVTEISNANLDAALFDVPAGYREVKSQTELYASLAQANSSSSAGDEQYSINQASPKMGSALGQSVSDKAQERAPNVSAGTGAKKAGVVRIGLASVKVGAVGEGLNATDLAAATQNTLVEYLKTPDIELVQLEAKLPSAIDAEARQKECDYVIYINVSHKKGGGGGFGKMFGSIAPAVAQTGIGHTGSTAGNISGQVATTAIVSAGSLSSNVKSKDEVTLTYKLQPTGGPSQTVGNTLKAKAKSDGEDILTPLIEQAAQAIVNTAVKR